MQNIEYQILKRIYDQCKYLLVPELVPTETYEANRRPATATAIVTGGAVTDFNITDSGAEYATVPHVIIAAPTDPDGKQAIATAEITNGAVTGFTIIDGGTAYDPNQLPSVTIDDPYNPSDMATWVTKFDYWEPNPVLIAPRQFLTNAEIEAKFPNSPEMQKANKVERNRAFKLWETQVKKFLPEDYTHREIVYLRSGSGAIDDLKGPQLFSLPALMIDLGGETLNFENNPTIPLGSEAKQFVAMFKIALTELDPTELYETDGLEIRLDKSRPGRGLLIRGQLRQILDPADFMNISQVSENYAMRSEVLPSPKLTLTEVVNTDQLDTILTLRYEVPFKEQITRS